MEIALAEAPHMSLPRKFFLGTLALFFLFFSYITFFDASPNSYDIGRIYSLPLGPVNNSDTLLFYNGSGTFSRIMVGDAWKSDRFLRMAVKSGENSYPGITFYMRESIPPDASLLVNWRAKGKPGRVLIDVTDGPLRSSPPGPGENFFVYCDTPGEGWSKSTFPLDVFERNPTQPPGAPKDGKFNTEGIQAISFTFFPLSDVTVDVREVELVWRSRHGYSSALIGFVLALGFLLWLRTTEGNILVPGRRTLRENAAIARIVFILVAVTISSAVIDGETRLTGVPPLVVFGMLCGLVLVDDFGRKSWMLSGVWSFRYLLAALAGFYLDFTHNPVILAFLLGIALVPLVAYRSRWMLFGGLLIAFLALAAHPRMNLSTTIVPGAMIVAALGVVAFLAFEILQHQRARREAGYIRSLYQDILENSSDGIYLLGPTGQIEAANRGLEELLGRPGTELVGRNIREFVHEEDIPLLDPGAVISAGRRSRQYDLRFITREGKTRIGLVREIPVFSGGSLSGTHAVATDITERKQTEVERESLLRELQTTMAETRSAGGFLPICAICKKIRDEAGSWNQLERYISMHFNAEFTHGICPDCVRKHYPELATKLEMPDEASA